MAELTPLDEAKRLNTPPLQGRGRGWGLTAGRLAELGSHARDMRRDPTEPEKRLWRHLSNSQLGGFKFRRQAVIGEHIADFLCPATRLVVEVDGDTHSDPAADARRDAALAQRGYMVVRVTNTDVMRNIEGVLEHLLTILTSSSLPFRGGAGGGASLPDASPVEPPHPNPSPEGEGLEKRRGAEIAGDFVGGIGWVMHYTYLPFARACRERAARIDHSVRGLALSADTPDHLQSFVRKV